MRQKEPLAAHVGRHRREAGLTQAELARELGVSRQTISDIENQRHVPGTDLALRLAKRFGVSVEELFSLNDAEEGGTRRNSSGPARLIRYTVDGEERSRPLTGLQGLREGLTVADGTRDASGSVQWFEDSPQPHERLMFMGCDPALGILVDYLNTSVDDYSYHWIYGSSQQSLDSLTEGQVQLAGVHFSELPAEEQTGFEQLETESRRFARWEQGLAVEAGNPLGIRDLRDLQRPGVRLVNREKGSGIRQWIDKELTELDMSEQSITGYQDTVPSHTEVARIVAGGRADVGVTMRSVAELFGLDFVPLDRVSFDFLIPEKSREHPALKVMLDALADGSLRQRIGSLAGYDTENLGEMTPLHSGGDSEQ